MIIRTCDVKNCNLRHLSKGYCSKHYQRIYKNNTLKVKNERGLPPYDRLIKKVSYEGECWVFTGCKTWQGYGHIRDGNTMKMAHRVSYEKHNNEIPHGMVIDHVCKNRACFNPQHLEVVTQAENVRRGNTGETHSKRQRNKLGQFQ